MGVCMTLMAVMVLWVHTPKFIKFYAISVHAFLYVNIKMKVFRKICFTAVDFLRSKIPHK